MKLIMLDFCGMIVIPLCLKEYCDRKNEVGDYSRSYEIEVHLHDHGNT